MSNKKSYFPHLIVGNTTKVSQAYQSTYLIPYSEPSSVVLTLILGDVVHGKNLTQIKENLSTNVDITTLIPDKAKLIAIFPEFEDYTEQLNLYDGTGAAPTLAIAQETLDELGVLWDSVFYFYTQNLDKYESILYDLILAIKLIHLSSNALSGEDLLLWWQRSQLLFPNPPFPLPKPAPKTISGSIPAESFDVLGVKSKLNDIEYTYTEILEAFDHQIELQKAVKISEEEFEAMYNVNTSETNDTPAENPPLSVEDSFQKYLGSSIGNRLSLDTIGLFTEKTRNTLLSYNLKLDLVDINFALKKLDLETKKLINSLPFYNADEVLLVLGDSLITLDDAIYGKIICEEESSLSHCALLHALTAQNPESTNVQILGMGLANVIRQQVVRHEAEEIAHIETVLDGESKVKTHRNLKIQEDFSYSETEKNQETETDTKSNSRFELAKEVSKIVNEDQQFQAGVQISASWGPTISVGANVNYATGSSTTQAAQASVKMSKDISERAVTRIQERALEIKESRSINEVEVTNVHSIENHHDSGHINGFYYWIDKVYENQVYNLGKRLMLEVMIPEPAAYHIFSSAINKNNGQTLAKPIHPSKYNGIDVENPLKSFEDITRTNFQIWGAKYDVQNLTPPPTDLITVSGSYALDFLPSGKGWHDFSYKDLSVPEDYTAKNGKLTIVSSGGSGKYIQGFLGTSFFSISGTQTFPESLTLSDESGFVPLSFRGQFDEFAMNVEVTCKVSDVGFDKWRIDTYNAIIGAYTQKLVEYESQLGQLENQISIKGYNPAKNREIERTELKKWAVELLTLQRFDGLDAMKKSQNGAPEIDFNEAFEEGKFVKFFEQAIEWHNMTYLFYPYFWAHKQRWNTLQQLNDTDPIFTKFLQAGYARVVIPVHPKFTKAVLHYFNSGEIWNGQDLPAIDDPQYLSIIQEIQEMEDNSDGDPIGDSWETRVPTNLTMIDGTIPNDLPGS